MTTLPSTTTVRLPRQIASSQGIALPPQTMPAFSGAAPATNAMTPADMWRLVRGNYLWILGTALVSLAAGLGIYKYQSIKNPKFRSIGYVVLNRPIHINPSGAGSGAYDDDFILGVEQKTQTAMLSAEALWNDVIEKSSKVRETDWFRKFQARAKSNSDGVNTAAKMAKDDLADNFRVFPLTDSKLLQISMDCASPDDAKDIVQEIVEAHIDNQRKATFDRTNLELNTATQWRDRYINLEAKTKSQMNDVNSSVAASDSPAAMRGMNVKEMTLSQLVGMQTGARMKANAAQATFDALSQQLSGGNDPYQVDAAVRNDPSVQRLRSAVDDMDMQLEAQKQSMGAKAPYLTEMQGRRDAMRAKLQKEEASSKAIARSQILDATKSEMASTKNEADSIDSHIESLRSELGEINAKIADYNSLKDEYDGYKELERQMNERVAVLTNALRQQVATVQWSNFPTRPDTLFSPNIKTILPFTMTLGVGLCVGIIFLRELTNTSVRSPRDVSRVGPMNVLGMVSVDSDDPQAVGVPMHQIISQVPGSMIAEQFRQIRTRLQHAASLDTTRTFVITSAGAGDGKTTVAINLATGLALNGRRILLVDANFRRPELHKLFNVPNDQGFSVVLDSISKLDSSVKKTSIPNLELLTAGPRPSNPTEMIESQLFSDFIDRALEEYDHVIFDAGPLLVVSEAVALAPRCDGVITVVRARKNTRGMLTRVREILRQIKAENLGVVLNGVQHVGGGYYGRNIKAYYAYQDTDTDTVSAE